MVTASAQAQATASSQKTHLTLKGSTAIVSDFFNFSVQSILYQRGIYPAEDFRPVKKYGLQMLITTDDGLETYIDNCLTQVKEWIEKGHLNRLVVAIVEKDTGETRERWQFDLDVVGSDPEAAGAADNGCVNRLDSRVLVAVFQLPTLDEPRSR